MKRIISILLAGILCIGSCLIGVSAAEVGEDGVVGGYTSDEAVGGLHNASKADGKDPWYWNQCLTKHSWESINGRGGESIYYSSCSSYAMGYALYKSGLDMRNPYESVIKPSRRLGIYENSGDYSWYFNFHKVNKLNSNFRFEGRLYNPSLDLLKQFYFKGKYLILCISSNETAGHMVFIDGFTLGNNIVIGDSYGNGTMLNKCYTGVKYVYAEVLSCKGKPCNSRPSIYGQSTTNALCKLNDPVCNKIYSSTLSGTMIGFSIPKSYSRYQIHIFFKDGENAKWRRWWDGKKHGMITGTGQKWFHDRYSVGKKRYYTFMWYDMVTKKYVSGFKSDGWYKG